SGHRYPGQLATVGGVAEVEDADVAREVVEDVSSKTIGRHDDASWVAACRPEPKQLGRSGIADVDAHDGVTARQCEVERLAIRCGGDSPREVDGGGEVGVVDVEAAVRQSYAGRQGHGREPSGDGGLEVVRRLRAVQEVRDVDQVSDNVISRVTDRVTDRVVAPPGDHGQALEGVGEAERVACQGDL